MKNKGVAIRYEDIAPNAKENFDIVASESKFNTVNQLKMDNLQVENYANPCELYQTLLDGTYETLPDNADNIDIGLWSIQLSDSNGYFSSPITLTLTSNEQYASQGFTFAFDTYNEIFCNDLNITWYRNNLQIATADFMPDNAYYFCQNKVENFDSVTITFKRINMPYNRLKLAVIHYGYTTFFYGDELKNVRVMQQIDPISSELAINTADFILASKRNIDYSFQTKQSLLIYFNGELKASVFVKKSTRKAKRLWNVKSEDYIGLMDNIPYYGGIYTNKNAVELLTDIFTVAKVPYSIDDVFLNDTVTGYIPFTTCREALMQVAFAIQAVVDTSNSDVVKVFKLEQEVKQTIPLNRIIQGQNFVNDITVTSIRLTAHSFKPITETTEVYNSEQSGTGTNIFVSFSEPLHDLSIVNGIIVSYGTNYAVINADVECVLSGRKYEHTTQTKIKANPIVLNNEKENVISIKDATLVSSSNIDSVLENCYNWLVKTDTINLKIVEGRHEVNGSIVSDMPVNLGENINTETEYLGVLSGRLISQSFNLNGNIIVKEAVIK